MRCANLSRSALFLVLFVAIAAALASGCQRMEKMGKNWESGNEGLNRTISLYDYSGNLVSRWTAKTHVEARRDANVVSFLDSLGRDVRLVGGIVVVQEN
jgi:hypothetical protein